MSIHKKISFVKSAIRIIGYFGLMHFVGVVVGIILVISEAIGIIEELGEK